MKSSYTLEMRLGLVIVTSCFLISMQGCATKQKQPTAEDMSRVANPAVSVVPVTPAEPPRVARISQDPVPIYKPARVREVQMDAYVNERGEAFPPSIKYVVEDPGGWNMEALRSPETAYVPPSSALEVPTAPGTRYTNMTQSSSSVGVQQKGRFLYDLKDVKVTGFTEMSQESRARGMAGPDDATIYDESLGWVLVPKSVIRGSSQGARPRATPIPTATPRPTDLGRTQSSTTSDFDILQNAPNPNVAPQPLELGGQLD